MGVFNHTCPGCQTVLEIIDTRKSNAALRQEAQDQGWRTAKGSWWCSDLCAMSSPFWTLPDGHYGFILADPPWKYETWSDKGQGKAPKYPKMTLAEIKALPVQAIAAKDCALGLWVTGPFLQKGFEVMEAWGFSYSGILFSWMKQNRVGPGLHMGNGKSTRKNLELCLLGRRGSPKVVAHDVPEAILSRVREESRKPDEQFPRIERLYGDVPRIELFARQRRDGWDAWGKETNFFPDLRSGSSGRRLAEGGPDRPSPQSTPATGA